MKINIKNSKKNSIIVSSKFNKVESKLFYQFVKSIKYGIYEINMSKNFLDEKYRIDQNNNWLNFFLNFSKKYFIYKLNNIGIEKSGIIRIISSFSFSNDNFNIKISQDLINIFDDTYNEFKVANFDNQLLFKNESTLKLYIYLYDKHILNNLVEVNLNELKKYLSIENQYPRFYDFEKHILKKSLKEIKEYKNISIDYSVIKSPKKNKIIGIKFFIKNKLNSLIEESALRIINQFQDERANDKSIIDYLKKQISVYGNKYVTINYTYSKLHNIDLVESIDDDYYHTYFEEKIKEYSNEVFSEYKQYSNKEEMMLNIIKKLKNTEEKVLILMMDIIDYLLVNTEMYRYGRGENKLYDEIMNFIKSTNEFYYVDENYTIIGEYNGNMISRFKIFKNI